MFVDVCFCRSCLAAAVQIVFALRRHAFCYKLYVMQLYCSSDIASLLIVGSWLQNFDEASPDPQAHLVDGPLKTARSAIPMSFSEDAAANGAAKRPVPAPEARKAIANEWITPDFAGMGI